MNKRAEGSFTVVSTPSPPYDTTGGVSLGHMALTKQYVGDLVGTSTVAMIAAMTSVKGSAGYVAIERFTGALHGRAGSFVLQHSGTMTRGAPSLTVSVVPDSATGDLTGLAAKMAIEVVEGKHTFALEYTLDGT